MTRAVRRSRERGFSPAMALQTRGRAPASRPSRTRRRPPPGDRPCCSRPPGSRCSASRSCTMASRVCATTRTVLPWRWSSHQPRFALLAKRDVAHRQHLVENQDIREPAVATEKPEPRQHAGRVVADRRVDELAEPAELDDLVVAARDLASRVAEQQGVEEDVLAPRQLVVEAGSELEDRRHAAAHLHPPPGGIEHPGDHLEQGRSCRRRCGRRPRASRRAAPPGRYRAEGPQLLVGERALAPSGWRTP